MDESKSCERILINFVERLAMAGGENGRFCLVAIQSLLLILDDSPGVFTVGKLDAKCSDNLQCTSANYERILVTFYGGVESGP